MPEITNEQIIQARKDIITAVGALSGGSGKMPPAVASTVIDFMFDETEMKNHVRLEKFTNDVMELHKVAFGRRVGMLSVEASDDGTRRGVSHSKIQLKPVGITIPLEVSKDYFQYAIQGMTAEERFLRMAATQAQNEVEELTIEGDTLGPAVLESDIKDGGSDTLYVKDSFMGGFNGWLRQADSALTLDQLGGGIGATGFSNQFRKLPTKFRKRRRDLRHFVSSDTDEIMRLKVSARATPEGDKAMSDDAPIKLGGVPLVPVPLFGHRPKVVEHLVLTATTASALRYKNVASVVVLPSGLNKSPTPAYSATTDYVLDAVLGTIARTGGSTIGSGATVKITYTAPPQSLCTFNGNLILAIGLDMEIDYDKDIYKRTWQAAMHLKVDCQVQELTALVKSFNWAEGA
jgi:hypothetical protein